MRQKVAKRLRKKIYGDKDFRDRKYTEITHNSFVWAGREYKKVTQVSDKERKWYQNAKKIYRLLKKQEKEKKNDESNTSEHNQ